MRLTEIKLDADLWPRAREDKKTVEHYTEIFEELPPIAVQKRTGKLVDGWHRFYAASKLGLSEVQVEEVDVPDNLVFAEAVKRNLKHGLPLKRRERDRAILRMSEASLSAHQIANIIGCHQTTVSRILKAATAQIPSDAAASLPLLHRVAIADAPPEKQPEIAKTVAEKKLTEKETKTLVEAISSPKVTEEDQDAMLYNPITRPYLRDQRGEKIQSLDSAMREIESVKKQADKQSTVKFWKTLQQLDKELSSYRPEEIAHGIEGVTIRLALETANSITRWFEAFRLEGAKLGYWEVSNGAGD
jgi:ParB-like chromosome segregation protein Spo0J